MNETLKFSWGHIIAFLALIALGYISFVGYSYLSAGNFFFAIAAMVATIIVFFAMFMGVQWLKADGNKIDRKFLWERIIVFASPLIFVGCLVGFAHFWTIKNQEDQIVEEFLASINNSRQLFSDFENYANNRIADYDATLSKVIAGKKRNSSKYQSLGFKEGFESAQKNNMIEVLKLQLLSDNYTKLKNEANQWIDKANNGASTWNVFLIGNTREIKSALINWEKDLIEESKPKVAGEEIYGPVEEFVSNGAINAAESLDSMSATFDKWKFPVWQAFFFGAIIYFLLLFPYFLQPRHGRQVAAGFSLFAKKIPEKSLDLSSYAAPRETPSPPPFTSNSHAPATAISPPASDLNQDRSTTNDEKTREKPPQIPESSSANELTNKLKQLKKRNL